MADLDILEIRLQVYRVVDSHFRKMQKSLVRLAPDCLCPDCSGDHGAGDIIVELQCFRNSTLNALGFGCHTCKNVRSIDDIQNGEPRCYRCCKKAAGS